MEEYKGNSHRSRAQTEQPEKRAQKVVSGSAKAKKRTDIARLTDVFISEDLNNVKDYILKDVLVPALKKALYDIITGGTGMALYGETSERRKSSAPWVSYRAYGEESRRPQNSRGYSPNDVILDNRSDAEEVLDGMLDIIVTYGTASVADLYDLTGLDCDYTDHRYGWTSLKSARVERVRDGYLLKLPRPVPLN